LAEDNERESTSAAGISRGQNVVYAMPYDWASIAHFLAPALARVEPSPLEIHAIQLLVVTPDVDVTTTVARTAVRLASDRGVAVLAATSAGRARRLLKERPVPVLVGAPDILVDLLRGAAVKLERVRAVAVAWIDDVVAAGGAPHLETLMADLPKDAARIVVAGELTPAVEELIERYARRARRDVPPTAVNEPTAIEYVAVSATSRLDVLRRVLDMLDPRSALVFVRSDESEVPVRELLRALGYGHPEATIQSGRLASADTEVVILFDTPASSDELRDAMGAQKRRIVALVQPRQLPALRSLASGGTVSPLVLPEAYLRARGRDETMRAELRDVLTTQNIGRELFAVEPLLEDYDGSEIAAACLRLLEHERAARATARPAEAARPSTMVRLFVNVGGRDNVRAGDLVGAITSEAGVTSADVGKIDVRESHSLVEVSAAAADKIVDKLTGAMIRGRRAVARVDVERPPRPRDGRDDRSARPPRDRRPNADASKRGGRRERDGFSNERTSARGAGRRRDRE